MQKKRTYFLRFFATLALMFFGGQVNAQAEEQKAPEEQNGFTYKVIFPENQTGDVGYYDLKMEKGQKQTVEIQLINLGNKEITVDVDLNGARTNTNGVIEYGANKLQKDSSMKFDFKDIVKAPESITLKPESKQSVKMDITMPETSFDGIILGGIQLQRRPDDSEKVKRSGTMVVNEYAYVIGMILKENDVQVQPDLGFVKAYGTQQNYRNSFMVDIGNTKSTIIKDLTVETQIMTEKSDQVLYEAKKVGMRMAPNSVLNFPIDVDGEALKAGIYRAHVLATIGDQKWEWTETFKITNKEADKFNSEAIGLVQEKGFPWGLIAIIASIVMGLLITVTAVLHVLNKKKVVKKKRASSRKTANSKKIIKNTKSRD